MSSNDYYIQLVIIVLNIHDTTSEINLSPLASWNQSGVTVAGWSNDTRRPSLSQLDGPIGISVGNNDVLYISDAGNHRIVAVPLNSTSNTSFIASGTGANASQFRYPQDVVITNTSLYKCDMGNRRMQKQPLNASTAITVLNVNGTCWLHALYVDHNDNVYLSITDNHTVLLFHANSTQFSIVASTGINGSNNTQLNDPNGILVNRAGTIYVADCLNHRVMMWFSGATSGIIVVGDGTTGSSSTQLNASTQIIVDENECMYISEVANSRITRWALNATFGVYIVACTGTIGTASAQLQRPNSLSFDRSGSLYVGDYLNHRVQKFEILDFRSQYSIYLVIWESMQR